MKGRTLQFLDLFSGLGGVSRGFKEEGFDVTGVEINPEVAKIYGQEFKVICADVSDLNPLDFQDYDFIWGSPPCRDFSKISWSLRNVWKDPPNPERGLILVNTFLKFIEIAKPRFWCMENSPYLERYLKISPKLVAYFSETMRRGLWGNFPEFLVPRDMSKKILTGGRNRVTGEIRKPTHTWVYPPKFRSWEIAMIPLPVSRVLARTVRIVIEKNIDINKGILNW